MICSTAGLFSSNSSSSCFVFRPFFLFSTCLRSCCWRTWIEYDSGFECGSKGFLTKDEFDKALDKHTSTRIRDSRELEAFWSAYCGMAEGGVDCNLRFFREGVQPSWEGSGAHGKFAYSTKKRYTKVKLFALLRTALLEARASPSASSRAAHSRSAHSGSGPQQRSLRYCAVVQRSKGQSAPSFVRGTRTC